MIKTHRVRPGEDIASLAVKHGFLPETLWDDAGNSELKQKREDPEVLQPGDELVIPERRRKEEAGATETRHKFTRKGLLTEFRLVIEENGVPLADKDYTLTVDGRLFSGTTDGDGLLEVSMPATARRGVLTVEGTEYELVFGGIDPIDEVSGIQTRLLNLGFYSGSVDGRMGPKLQRAVADFQAHAGIEATGEATQETKDRLFALQDEAHESRQVEETEDSEDEPEATEQVVDDEDLADADGETQTEEGGEDGLDDSAVEEDESNLPDVPEDESDDHAQRESN